MTTARSDFLFILIILFIILVYASELILIDFLDVSNVNYIGVRTICRKSNFNAKNFDSEKRKELSQVCLDINNNFFSSPINLGVSAICDQRVEVGARFPDNMYLFFCFKIFYNPFLISGGTLYKVFFTHK